MLLRVHKLICDGKTLIEFWIPMFMITNLGVKRADQDPKMRFKIAKVDG